MYICVYIYLYIYEIFSNNKRIRLEISIENQASKISYLWKFKSLPLYNSMIKGELP